MKNIILVLIITTTVFCSQFVFAQNKQISGVVILTDSSKTLSGVTVMVKGTNIGTITDKVGKYTLNAPNLL